MKQDKTFSARLSHDLFMVDDGRRLNYGGSQNMYGSPRERSNGCGIAGAADVILYMKALNNGDFTVPVSDFLELSKSLKKKYIPIIPGRGVNAFILAMGLNRYFKKNGLKYRARWKWTRFKKWKTVASMLEEDIPVILAIGNNFPLVWGKKELYLYVNEEEGKTEQGAEPVYRKSFGVYGHFVVVTAIEGNCLTVSSWGKKYYINIDEYDAYVKKHSIHLYSNILSIKKK